MLYWRQFVNLTLCICYLQSNAEGSHDCSPVCCKYGIPKHTPPDCALPPRNNKTGCPECPTVERPTCKSPPECLTPDPPCPDPPPPNMTIVPAYCVANGGRLCYRCYVDTTVCSGGILLTGNC